MPIHSKVAGAGVGAAIAAVIIAILHQSHVTVTAELSGAIETLAAFAGGWLAPANSPTTSSFPPAVVPPPRPQVDALPPL